MRVIAISTLKKFNNKHKLAEQSVLAWYEEVSIAKWKNHNQLKQQYSNASIISTRRVVFNVHGNNYRLVVDIEYKLGIVFIVWIGTHKAYDNIEVKTITYVKTN